MVAADLLGFRVTVVAGNDRLRSTLRMADVLQGVPTSPFGARRVLVSDCLPEGSEQRGRRA